MRRLKKAFTLAELLVVIAILSILCAILFPVFSGVRESAKRVACASNLHQIWSATDLYGSDYDDKFIPTNYRPGVDPNSRGDRTWVQLLLPYVRSFAVFKCPSDSSERPKPEATFDQDLVPGDTYSQYYTASMRSNYGYNYQYLAPIVWSDSGWSVEPREMSSVSRPSDTLLFVDSVWSRTDAGVPLGGGNWLVEPPCRYQESVAGTVDTFTGTHKGAVLVYSTSHGWITDPNAPSAIYGNAWPWHAGRMNVLRVDGSVKSITPSTLAAGCQVEDQWGGTISNPSEYMWSLR